MRNIWMLIMVSTMSTSLFAHVGYADLVEEIQGAIVNIRTTQTVQNTSRNNNPFNFFGTPQRERESEGAGSGFIISRDGFIVTNRHVVEGADDITVFTNSEEEYSAKLIGTDENLDIALIKIEGNNFSHLTMGDSSKLRIGDPVLAIGYPLQLGFSVTAGIVSGIGRNMRTSSLDLATYIQTDADITFGNSGGPLVNPKGEVVAINTMIVTRGETYGFAIPTELFEPSIEQLKNFGEVKRGALGITVGNLTAEAKEYFNTQKGALVTGVTRGLPAAKAGIEPDQVIVAIDGKSVSDSDDLIGQISKKFPGDKIELSMVDSRGKSFDKTVTLTDRRKLGNRNFQSEEETAENVKDIPLGFSVAPLDRRLRREMSLESNFSGVLVESVKKDSIAEQKGIRAGQIITEINHKKVVSAKDILKTLDEIPDRKVFPMRIVSFISDGFNLEKQERTVFLREN